MIIKDIYFLIFSPFVHKYCLLGSIQNMLSSGRHVNMTRVDVRSNAGGAKLKAVVCEIDLCI